MKTETTYICETCGKRFPTSREADICEKKHELDNKRIECIKKSSRAISELIERHINTFGEYPTIELSDTAWNHIKEQVEDEEEDYDEDEEEEEEDDDDEDAFLLDLLGELFGGEWSFEDDDEEERKDNK